MDKQMGSPNYRGLVEVANSIILSIDAQGKISYINPFGLYFFGFSEKELLGHSPVGSIIPERSLGGSKTGFMTDIIKDPEAYAGHTNENLKKDGTRVWVSWTNKGIFDDQGHLSEVLCVGNDITRIKRMEEELFDHRRNLESLVDERTWELRQASKNLVSSQNRLMVLTTISACIIEDKTISFTVSRVLEQLSEIFKSCGAAYIKVIPGATLLTIDHAFGPPPLPDITGMNLDMGGARPFFQDMINNFKPYAFTDTQIAENRRGLDAFVKETAIRSGMAIPLRQNDKIMGILFVYCLEPRPWSGRDTQLMNQVGEALAVGIGHRQSKNRLKNQDRFLGNVFEGMDIGLFVLAVQKGVVLFERVNHAYESLRHFRRSRLSGTSLDRLSRVMDPVALDLFKQRIQDCIQEKKTIKFLEETREGVDKKYWLTRLKPVMDDKGGVFRIIGASTEITEQKQTEAALVKNEARLREAQRISRIGDFERRLSSKQLSCSHEIYKIFGWAADFCPRVENFMDTVHPEDREFVIAGVNRAIEQKTDYDIEYRIDLDTGEQKIVNEIGVVKQDDSGKACKISGIIQDVTEQKAFKDEIELARKVFDNAVEGVMVTDKQGTIEFVNKGFTTITGYTEQEAIGNTPRLFKSDRHDRQFYTQMWATLIRDGHWNGEIWNRRKNGEAYPEWLSITAILNRQGEPVRYMSVFSDLSDIREREEQLVFQANFDALTGLPNRTLLQDRITVSLSRSARDHDGLAVIFLDMDDFKHVNDTLGHAKGDLLLQQFASRLLGAVREQDTVARYGGDEFIVLIPDTNDPDTIITIIERIQASLDDSFVIDTKEFFLRVSIGVTLSPQDGKTPDVLIANADMAMYRSKERQKGGYAFFTTELNRQVTRRVELEVDLRYALARQELTLFFQPKLDIATQKIIGAEALVRWMHPNKGIVPPNEFIPLAEETGLINSMGEWILDQACIRAREWSIVLNRNFGVAVNISSRQVKDADLVTLVSSALTRNNIPPACLEIEITESAVMENVDKAKIMFRTLHDMGIKISIDDFGTGFSSLSYLRLFPVSVLKIDKSFIDDIPKDKDSNTMVTTIISMARHLNLTTVAEGVEEREQLDFLVSNRCDQIQGYYFARPMPADEFIEFVTAQE